MAIEPQGALPVEQKEQAAELFPFADILRDIGKQWNKAESAIKRAEQICDEVAHPAVTELRYAGRRMIDALDAAHHGGNIEKIQALFEDARFCCYRAQHDAIDAAMSKIAIDLDNMTRKLGFDAVIAAYPEFREFYAEFAVARRKIAESRRNRGSRNDVYEALTATDLPNLAERYEKLMECRPIAKWNAFKIRAGGVWGFLIGSAAIIGAVFAGLTWFDA
ncbi:MAG: hypothetical protein CL808_08200 [Citromicrobium sp.]|nr:hypothetical protein [Citromicrobium sp.]